MRVPTPSTPAAASPAAGLTPFESYYRKQRIVPDDEWPAFAAALQSPLPLDVRVSHRAPLASRAFERLVALLPDANERPLPWAGSGVWQLDRPAEPARVASSAPHRDGRGDGSYQPARARSAASPPPFPQRATPEGYHQFLHRQQKRGALHRQESASMLPALLLMPRPDDSVLDMCAAPGSKSLQLIEMARGGSGMVWCNDASLGRAISLNHRLQGANTASPGAIVTSLDARYWPDRELQALRFDKVLCDVPCSGDGTLRKSHRNTPAWSAAAGAALHATQIKILRQGLKLLAPGGCLVYSTCSLNPAENEAVVTAILREERGCSGGGGGGGGSGGGGGGVGASARVSLWDPREFAPSALQGLHPAPGLDEWQAQEGEDGKDDDVGGGSELGEREGGDGGGAGGGGGARGVAPPPSAVERGWLSPELRKCVRLLPHRDTCGGFFVACFRKEGAEAEAGVQVQVQVPVPDEAGAEAEAEAEAGAEENSGAEELRRLSPASDEWCSISAFYGIDAPPRGSGLLWAPMRAKKRAKLYLATDAAAAAVTTRWRAAARGAKRGRLNGKLHHAGAKAFERLKLTNLAHADSFPCQWRLCQQVLPDAASWVRRRRLSTPNEALFATALRDGGLPRDALAALGGYDGCCDAEGALEPGGALLCLEPALAAVAAMADGDGERDGERDGGGELPSAPPPPPPLACVACVIGPSGSLSLWLPKEERAGLLELLCGAG
jgi:16S rRNA C967 or C1407 C5-methylase (RsmB/RsmF family)